MENPIKMDDLGVPLFLETPKYTFHRMGNIWFGHWTDDVLLIKYVARGWNRNKPDPFVFYIVFN